MIQIAYHPAFDAGHASFRFLRLKVGLNINRMEFDRLRILDFYVLFPHRAASIRLMQKDTPVRALAKQAERSAGYSVMPSDVVLFGRMEAAQVAAAQTMGSSGAISEAEFNQGVIQFEPFEIPPELELRVVAANAENSEAMSIVKTLAGYPLLGLGGLKDRSGLLEYRYDAV